MNNYSTNNKQIEHKKKDVIHFICFTHLWPVFNNTAFIISLVVQIPPSFSLCKEEELADEAEDIIEGYSQGNTELL